MARLWFGMLAGPLAWLAYLETVYALVGWACAGRHRLALHAAAALAVAATAVAAVVARRSLPGSATHDDQEDRAVARARFMAHAGIGLSLLSALLIAAGAVPALLLDPCD